MMKDHQSLYKEGAIGTGIENNELNGRCGAAEVSSIVVQKR